FGPFESEFGDVDARTNGIYGEGVISPLEFFSITVSGRVDDHSDLSSKETFRLAPVAHIDETGTTLRGTFGTGFKAPSLFQLFSNFGNPDLKPEESRGW